MSDKVQGTSFYSFKVFIKPRVFDTYRRTCEIVECKACAIINKLLTTSLSKRWVYFIEMLALIWNYNLTIGLETYKSV